MLTRTPEIALAVIEHAFFLDAEMCSALDLPEVGVSRYAAHPSTIVRCVCYAVDDGPVKLWRPGDPVPREVRRAASKTGWVVVAHNRGFEAAVLERILTPQYGWPAIDLSRWCCTLATAASHALPPKLETLAEALGLEHQKDAEGTRLMRQLAKPQAPREDDPERLARLYAYCAQDVQATREAYYRLPSMPPHEVALWQLDQIINARGIPFDRVLIAAAHDLTINGKPTLNQELAELTEGAVISVDQVGRLKIWLAQHGWQVESLEKEDVAKALLGPVDEVVRRVLELRQAGAKNTTAKFAKMLDGLDDDDRARWLLFYHAASTGRWSSRRINIHNLARTAIKDPEPAIAAVLSRDLEQVQKLGSPLIVLSNIVRATICAPPGRVLMGADFSGIEARVLAWLVNETRKLKAFIEYDRTGDPRLDPYLVVAAMVFGVAPGTFAGDASERKTGKTCDLAFGYGGSVAAWRAFEPDPRNPLPDEEVEELKLRGRTAHPNVERFWYAIKDAAVAAVHRRGQLIRCGRVTLKQIDEHLYLKLPSGRMLCYPYARIEFDSNRRKQVICKDNAKGAWRDTRLWYGTLTENIVSGIARDLLCAALLRIEHAGFPVIFHVHDELVVEVPETAVELEKFKALMTIVPPWAEGLPIAAKAWTSRRYVKS